MFIRHGCWLFLLALILCGFSSLARAEPDTDTVTLRFVVAVPDDTPKGEAVYLCGGDPRMGAWDGKGLALEAGEGGDYIGSLSFKRGAHVLFKATRGSWEAVEKNEWGGEIENRHVVADSDRDVSVIVAGWAGGQNKPIESTLTGDIRRHDGFRSEILDNERTLLVYLPPGYETQTDLRYPVLYMHDGQNLFDAATSFAGHEWRVDEAAQRLIAEGKIEPIIIVGIYNNADRMTEYTPRPVESQGDAYARFVAEEVKPFIDRTYRTDPSAKKTGIAGSSLGGLISLYMVWAHSDTFGRCGGVSPSLWWDDRWLIRQWQAGDMAWAEGKRVWVDMGTSEGQPGEGGMDNPAVRNARMLKALLEDAGQVDGVGFRYLEVEGGHHNEQAWAGRIEAVLAYLYGL